MGGVKLVVAGMLAVIAVAALLIASPTAAATKALGDDYITHVHPMPSKARAPTSAKARCGVIARTTPAPVVHC
jgi:hypothetical protein